jgi:hypothetical protein
MSESDEKQLQEELQLVKDQSGELENFVDYFNQDGEGEDGDFELVCDDSNDDFVSDSEDEDDYCDDDNNDNNNDNIICQPPPQRKQKQTRATESELEQDVEDDEHKRQRIE